jgi:hypothetical protein
MFTRQPASESDYIRAFRLRLATVRLTEIQRDKEDFAWLLLDWRHMTEIGYTYREVRMHVRQLEALRTQHQQTIAILSEQENIA